MSTKAFFFNSDTAQYGQAEINGIGTLLLSAGVLNSVSADWAAWATGGDLLVVQRGAGANMSVDVGAGWLVMATTRVGQTFKIFAQNLATANVVIAGNSSGANRVDAIIARISRSASPDVSVSNVFTIERVAGTGASALSDGAISAAIGSDDFIRLANVTVPNSASSIVTANIADTRTPARIGKSVRFALESIAETQAVTSSSGALSVDFSLGNVAEITLTENITSGTLSGGKAGGRYLLRIKQHASAAKTVALGTSGKIRFSNTIYEYIATVDVGAVDELEFIYHSGDDKYDLVRVTKGFQTTPNPEGRKLRVQTVTQSATPAINTNITDTAVITGLAQAITSFTTNLTGTPVDKQFLEVCITDNGTARAITWGASFEASTVALPTTTVISTMLSVLFQYNSATSKWRCVAAV